ncbi:mitochondrial protein [Punctularia strigosozonata HHB-11173 SS5]|uniref:mitochondrial protein n=1 Tax=Punctularia strigosozonata (strain HHB-11173) TaxID=741275 RepID=UPI0004417E32|nr:mitochondrial protein [Punctularia strigosozonata HHB-11173 SS5]EIN07307.1 mitochondrial protein [Punctularia strigosozonata HHB-11173 SS5]
MVLEAVAQKVLVVGGNGFIGSAVCKAALARGMQVTSISSSGKPYTTPKGHSPAWTSKVDWRRGDALNPESYAHILPEVTGVVHTLGTLLEDAEYKKAIREGNVFGLAGSVIGGLTGASFGGGNPLERKNEEHSRGSYALLNRDAALRVCEAFISSKPNTPLSLPRSFVFISAEDIFRPLVPAGYIETKREAERQIESMMLGRQDYRGVFIRPSLVYHAHYRPLTSPVAALLDLSASLHSRAPVQVPTPSSVLRTLASLSGSSAAVPEERRSPLESMANALIVPPIHVDHVGEACSIAVDVSRFDVAGPVGVREMRHLIGWEQKGQPAAPPHPSHTAVPGREAV